MDATKIEATDKLWGKAWPVFLSRHCEVWTIEVVAGGYCSQHCHEEKSNSFFVQSGCLQVHLWPTNLSVSETVTLRAGDKLHVKAGMFHMFEALEPTVAIETYYSEDGKCRPEDIGRISVGGIRDDYTEGAA